MSALARSNTKAAVLSAQGATPVQVSLCDDVFDSGTDAAMGSPVLVADCAAGVVAPRRGDGPDAAVAAIAQNHMLGGEQVREGVAGDHDVVAVAPPAAADGDDAAGMGADDDLGVGSSWMAR